MSSIAYIEDNLLQTTTTNNKQHFEHNYQGGSMFILRPIQKTMAEKGLAILKKYGLAYNVSEERTGKTASTLYLVELTIRKKLLVVTKKAAIDDFKTTIIKMQQAGLFTKEVEVINYESLHKIKIKPDIIIFDEAHHSLGSYPKPSKTLQTALSISWGLPIIYMSATPHSESYAQLYHQLRLSQWSPFVSHPNFYDWFRTYGVPEVVYLGKRTVPSYKTIREDLVKPIFDCYSYGVTRQECGFTQEAEDVPLFVELDEQTVSWLKDLATDKSTLIDGKRVLAQSISAELQKKHQIEGGTIKLVTGQREVQHRDGSVSYKDTYESFNTGNTEKIDYIKKYWKDDKDLVIMYHYQQEEQLLKEHFSEARILQADRFAEGISLMDAEHLIVYSMSWRTSKYIQRRSRQADLQREKPIKVYYLLVRDEMSHMVYDCVAVKRENFTARMLNSYYQEGM